LLLYEQQRPVPIALAGGISGVRGCPWGLRPLAGLMQQSLNNRIGVAPQFNLALAPVLVKGVEQMQPGRSGEMFFHVQTLAAPGSNSLMVTALSCRCEAALLKKPLSRYFPATHWIDWLHQTDLNRQGIMILSLPENSR